VRTLELLELPLRLQVKQARLARFNVKGIRGDLRHLASSLQSLARTCGWLDHFAVLLVPVQIGVISVVVDHGTNVLPREGRMRQHVRTHSNHQRVRAEQRQTATTTQ
jgi:hypothetical protein